MCGKNRDSCPNALTVFKTAETFFRRIFAQKNQTKTKARALLDECKVFVKLSPFRREQQEHEIQELPPNIWAYIGYVNRSTWHFTVLQMFEAEISTWEPCNSPEGIVVLSIPDAHNMNRCLLTDIELFKGSLDFDFSYKCEMFSLVDQEGCWDPTDSSCQFVPVCPLQSAEEFVVWNPPDKQETGQATKTQKRQQPLTEERLIQMLENQRPAKRVRSMKEQEDPNDQDHDTMDKDDEHDDETEAENSESDEDHFDLDDEAFVADELGSPASSLQYSPSLADPDTDFQQVGVGDGDDAVDMETGVTRDEIAETSESKPNSEETNISVAQKLSKFLNTPQAPNDPASADAADGDNASVGPGDAKPASPSASRAFASRDRSSTETLSVPGCGLIRFLPGQNVLVAVCDHPGHGDCRRQKTLASSSTGTQRGLGQGRPLGFLCAWLRQQMDHDDRERHVRFNPSFDQRKLARQWLVTNVAEASSFSQQHERACRAGEDAEPKSI